MSLSAISSLGLQYPVSPYVVPEKLWFDDEGTNFPVWKAHLVHLYQPHSLLGFLDGTNPPPPKTILSSSDCKTMIRNPDYVSWRRTDQFLKERISTLLEDSTAQPAPVDDSSRGLWINLEEMFQQHLNQIANGSTTGAVPITSGRQDRLRKDRDEYSQLCNAVQQDNWTVAEEIVNSAGEVLKATGLRVAVGSGKRANEFVKNLVTQMSVESISAKDAIGNTALSIAAASGNINAATILVDKHRDLLYVPNILGEFPIHIAAKHARRNILVYLIDETNDDHSPENPYAGLSRLSLLISIIRADFYDIALDLVKKYPYLARAKDSTNSAMKSIAQRKHVFFSGKYSISTPDGRNYIPYSNRQTDEDYPALDLVKFLCLEMQSLNLFEAEAMYHDAILIAARLGNHKIVEVILENFPDAIYCSDPASLQSITHIAVENHSERVFNLICHMSSDRVYLNLDLPDVNGNNLLHLAAKLSPSEKLRVYSNAIARMRHEVEWFKAVENMVHPLCKDQLNNAGKSPTMIFKEEHSKLRKEGGEWMKNSANTFIIVAVLISTLTFAAAITVPGGNDSNSGLPLYSRLIGFMSFAWFDSIAFLLSIISLLAFLHVSITSYGEEDIELKPWVFSLGWYSLSFSVYSLVITFTQVIGLLFVSRTLTVELCYLNLETELSLVLSQLGQLQETYCRLEKKLSLIKDSLSIRILLGIIFYTFWRLYIEKGTAD